MIRRGNWEVRAVLAIALLLLGGLAHAQTATVPSSGGGSGLGDALVANPLSQFAATSCPQFAGVITGETGTCGAVVLSQAPVFGGTVSFGTASTSTGILRLLHASHAFFNDIQQSGSQAASITYTLPTTDGGASEFLQTNGSGVLTWAAAGGGVTIGDTQVAYATAANTLGGEAGMTYNSGTDTLTVATAVTTPTHNTAPGVAVAVTATAPTAANGASQAGVAASLTASAATASLDTAGAAAGGDVNVTAGAAARLTSGNAAGGNVILLGGAGIGTGVAGQVRVRQAGTITAPAFTINSSGGGDDSGLYNRTTDTISFTTASVHRGEITAAGQLVMMSDKAIGWFSATTPSGAGGADTALNRHSAGVIRASLGGSEIHGFLGGGAAVASATALPLPTGRVFHVTGTTTITSITSTGFGSGAVITLIFDGVLTFTDGGNLILAGNFVTAANGTITLVYDGTNWYETSRSVN